MIQVSIITPVYNKRERLLERNFKSVRNQTCQDIEHIIIDDGSDEDVKSVAEEYKKSVSYPVIFIRKQNGGVHTARNKGLEFVRGKFLLFLDSDDEIMPDAVEWYLNQWKNLDLNKYWCVRSRVKTEMGKFVGKPYPDSINRMKRNKAVKTDMNLHAEKYHMINMKLFQNVRWPECYGVTYVMEGLIWGKMDKKYLTYYSNYVTRIGYSYDKDKQTNTKKTYQAIKNRYFSYYYFLKHHNEYIKTWKTSFRNCFFYRAGLFETDKDFKKEAGTKIPGFMDNILSVLLSVPAFMYSKLEKKEYGD